MPNSSTRTVSAHRRRRLHHARRELALACALLALPVGTAAATQPPPNYAYASEANPAATTVIRVEVPSGFDWGDAAIGAAASLGIFLAALGGGLGITRRHHQTPTSIGAIH